MYLRTLLASSVIMGTMLGAGVASASVPSISSFVATPSSISLGQNSTLSWNVANASSTFIDQGVGSLNTGSSSAVVSPATTTTYTLFAVNPEGTTTASTLVTVASSFASSTTSIQVQIASLLQQIHALQQQLASLIASQFTGSATTTPSAIPPGQIVKACVHFSRDLMIGDDGDDVRQLQQVLAEDPTSGFTASTSGYFGPLTAHALGKFQEEHGITTSGTDMFGPLTRGYFVRGCEGVRPEGEGSTTTASTSIGVTPSASMQILLPDLGHSEGHGNGNSKNDD